MILLGASMSLCFWWWAKECFLSVSTGIVSGQEFAVLERIHSSLATAQELSVRRQWPGKAEDNQGNINKQQEHGSLLLWSLNLFTQNLGIIPGTQAHLIPLVREVLVPLLLCTTQSTEADQNKESLWRKRAKLSTYSLIPRPPSLAKGDTKFINLPEEVRWDHTIVTFKGQAVWMQASCLWNVIRVCLLALWYVSSLLWVNAYLLPHKAALLAQCSLQAHPPQTKRVFFSSPVLQHQLHKRGEST